MNNIKKYSFNKVFEIKPQSTIIQDNSINNIKQEVITLTKRLYIQLKRRPSTFIISIIQPLLWLILFGSLFQNFPINLLTKNIQYNTFLTPGIITFTSFNGAIYAGLPLIFDREFGFLNRLIVSPLILKDSLLMSYLISITITSLLQTIIIILFNAYILNNTFSVCNIDIILQTIILITIGIASISISLAFILPGHIEFLAILLLTNLPTLFASTTLAPLSFMPYWLQILTSLNPLTYATEILRYVSSSEFMNYKAKIIKTVWIQCSVYDSLTVILLITIVNLMITKYILKYKYE